MTLIETAIQKLQKAGAASPATTPNRMRLQERVAQPVPSEPPRTYLPSTLDSTIMEQCCILPRISDESALRAYKILRTRLLQTLHAQGMHSLVVTGTDAQQGKSLTAINLAFALAQDPSTSVFLVDLDLRRPHVAPSLGMQFNHGLGDYLAGKAEIEQIIYESGVPRLAIVPNAYSMEHSSELLGSDRMQALVQHLSAATPRRVVIYDMPPVLMADDVIAFVPQVDGVLLVVSELSADRAKVEKARDILSTANILGVVLNRSSERNDAGYY
jgi:capsular exopolysaccharide synthesis family protein